MQRGTTVPLMQAFSPFLCLQPHLCSELQMYLVPSISDSLGIHSMYQFPSWCRPTSHFGFHFLWLAKSISLVHLLLSLSIYLWLCQYPWTASLSIGNGDMILLTEKDGECASEVVQ